MASFFDLKARKEAAASASGSSKAAKGSKEENTRLQPWVEKYRPRTLDDITAQSHTTLVLSRLLHTSNLPHMLFYGPPGTGKTSTILALAKQLFGPELFRSRVLELNASDERGISIVREKVKDFARQQLSAVAPGLKTADGRSYRDVYPVPGFKIIVLDEADSMTQDAQSALRRTMETYSRITRFCLVCNYVTRIIDPLASRCSKFRFKSLDKENAGKRLEEIAQLEGVKLGEGAVDALVRCSEGDLRKAITFLQSAARLVGAMQAGKGKGKDAAAANGDAMDVDGEGATVTVDVIEEIAGVVPDSTIDRLFKAMTHKGKGVVYDSVSKVVTDMVADGWSATQVVGQLYDKMLFDETIEDTKKNRIVMVFSEADKRLIDGADEHLVILDLTLRVADILGGS